MDTVKIVTNVEPGEPATSRETKVIAERGEVCGITSMNVYYRPNDRVRADIELYVWVKDVDGVTAYYFMKHPFTGETVEVKEIVMADGERIDL